MNRVRYHEDDHGPENTDYNPHETWPIEPLCCSFHWPVTP